MHEYSAGSIVYRIKNNKIEFLLVQSRLNRTWGFPKGHLEKDENNVQAAQREVYEEVGLKPDYDYDFEESITYKIARDRLKTVTLFLSRFNPDQKIELQKSEIGDYKWAALAEANSCLNYEELKELLPVELNDKIGYSKFENFVYTNEDLNVEDINNLFKVNNQNIYYF